MNSNYGKIIYLNGVTSSGKTSVGREMQRLSPRNIYRFSNDMFFEAVSEKFLNSDFMRYHAEAIFRMYKAALAISEDGCDIIIDGMLLDCEWQEDHFGRMKNIFAGRDLTVAGLLCPLEECRRRNIARGDRREDQSEWQSELMAKNIGYDLTIDTSVTSPSECAKIILSRVFPSDALETQ